MVKIKPFIWTIPEEDLFCAETPFGSYEIDQVSDVEFSVNFVGYPLKFETLELAKRFAFDDFKRRLEETIGEPVGYDLPIDENC